MHYLATPSILQDRASMLCEVRKFFSDRQVLEVDCPALVPFPAIDNNIDVMEVHLSNSEIAYLHTSPEYAMKRLICYGLKDIYQIAHVFRKGEIGSLHSPEFTMIEWYRLGKDYFSFIEETCCMINLFLGKIPCALISYQDAFQKYASLDPFEADQKTLIEKIKTAKISITSDLEIEKRDTLLQLILIHLIEPYFSKELLTILYEFPSSQAALAKTFQKDGHAVAERFEIYFKGVELANGYHELCNAEELKNRFEEENICRIEAGKDPYPLDTHFLQALTSLPDCCGVAVGFDRLMMLKHNRKSIHEILPFSWFPAP